MKAYAFEFWYMLPEGSEKDISILSSFKGKRPSPNPEQSLSCLLFINSVLLKWLYQDKA